VLQVGLLVGLIRGKRGARWHGGNAAGRGLREASFMCRLDGSVVDRGCKFLRLRRAIRWVVMRLSTTRNIGRRVRRGLLRVFIGRGSRGAASTRNLRPGRRLADYVEGCAAALRRRVFLVRLLRIVLVAGPATTVLGLLLLRWRVRAVLVRR